MRKKLSKLPTHRQLKVGELLRHKVSEELIKLAELHSKGIINDDEFEKAKEKILD